MGKLIDDDEVPRVAMQVTQHVLVVSVQIELYEASLRALRDDLLDNIRRTGVRQALIDLSAVEVIDTFAYGSICDTANMAKVMGTSAVLTGIKPGVASALIEFDVDVKRTDTALNLEAGFALFDSRDDGNEGETEAQADIANDDGTIEDDPDAGGAADGPADDELAEPTSGVTDSARLPLP